MWISNLKNRHAVSLRKLFPSASFVGCADIHVTTVSEQSQDCSPGCLFAAVQGHKVDGQQFIQEAIFNGASAILCGRPQPQVNLPQCIVPHVRSAYAGLCQALFGMPSQRLTTVGITGTNGKSTTTYLVRSILQAAEKTTGLLGTIEYSDGILTEPSHLTTPDPPTLARWLHQMVEQETTHAVFELSSHAMHQERTAGVQLDVAVITNITHDHLDYHQTFENYIESKTRILNHLKPKGCLVLNQDYQKVRNIGYKLPKNQHLLTYAIHHQASVRATELHQSLEETQFLLQIEDEAIRVSTKLIGKHNVENCLAAAATAHYLGVNIETIARGIEQLHVMPGRLESIKLGQDYKIYVDYAHTDDALRHCINTLKPLTKNRLICVFGAGGERDCTKRPKLARAAQEADIVIITSDNPRREDPNRIIEDILKGFPANPTNVYVEPNREHAIQLALELAVSDDTLLVAGKGHENYQVIGETRHEFDDREILQENLLRSPIRLSA